MFDKSRVQHFLQTLVAMAAGDRTAQLPITSEGDDLDAIAYAVNALADELTYAKEEEKKAHRSKDDFLAYMSHEVRTPLSVILGYASQLQDTSLSGVEKSECIERIITNGEYLLKLVEDILDLSKIEAGKVSLEVRQFQLHQFVNDSIASLKSLAKSKAIELELISEIPLQQMVRTDPTRLNQILLNVVNNAIKFTHRGFVRVRLWQPDKSKPIFCVDVKDSGIGIENRFMQQMFQPFSQENRTTSPSPGSRGIGSGLGLSLSKKLAQALGGNLELIETKVDEGSTFRVCIVSHEQTTVSVGEAIKETPVKFPGELSILIAEDNQDLRELFCYFLESIAASVHIDTVDNGTDAVAMALAKTYDVILMDVQMPKLSGIEAVKQLRGLNYSAPILCVTARVLPEQEKECWDVGFNDVLHKPVDAKVLRGRVLKFVEAERS